MTYLSYGQLRAYAASAGASDPDTAAAVGLAETGGTGDTRAHNPIPPDDSYGPWQINMLGPLGPDRRKKLGITSNSQLYDPAINARAMVMISNGGGNFSPWSTYTSGAYKKYLKGAPTGGTGAQPANSVDPANVITDTASSAKDAVKVVIDAANWMVNPSNWLRVVYVVAGGAVILVGLDMLLQQQVLGRAAKALGGDGSSTMGSAATIGKKVFSPGGKAKTIKNVAPKTAPGTGAS